MIKLPQGVFKIKSAKAGPIVGLVGIVHGNEKCGKKALDYFRNKYRLDKKISQGTIYLIYANPKACRLNKREYQKNLNRLFHYNFSSSSKRLNCEEKRALELKSVLDKVDYLLYLHSTSQPSQPMVICPKKLTKDKICQNLNVKFAIYNLDKGLSGTTLIQYVNNHGGKAVAVECGQHNQKSSFVAAKKNVLNFLVSVGVINTKKQKNKAGQIKVLDATKIVIAKTDKFRFVRKYNSFDLIKKGETFAYDGNKPVKASGNYYIIMPTKVNRAGLETCWLGKHIR